MAKIAITTNTNDERLFSFSKKFILQVMLREMERGAAAVLKDVSDGHYMMASGMEEVRDMLLFLPDDTKFDIFFEGLLEDTRRALKEKDDMDAEYYTLKGRLKACKIMLNVMIDNP